MIPGLAVTSRTLDHQAGVGSRMLTSLQHSSPPPSQGRGWQTADIPAPPPPLYRAEVGGLLLALQPPQ